MGAKNRRLSILLIFLVGLGYLIGSGGMGKLPSNIKELDGVALLGSEFLQPLPKAPEGLVAEVDTFAYYAPGNLLRRTGSGRARRGVEDWTVYAGDMAFPVKTGHPAFLNSQLYSPGGSFYTGHGVNNQCTADNYSYPWRDNFCERRWGADRESLNCPSREIHQGVDIRGGTGGWRGSACDRMASHGEKDLVPVVAVEDGRVEYSELPHKFVLLLITPEARIYRYLHLEMDRLEVEPGTAVKQGEIIGYLSNDFGRTRTTHHLHFEISQNVEGRGFTQVSPYMSLVRAYERDRGLEAVLVE